MGQHNIIELNGKRYDSITGVYLGKADGSPSHQSPRNGRVIDGFIRSPRPGIKATTKVTAPHVKKTTVSSQPVTPGHGKNMDIHRTSIKHTAAHKPERPKTLMRRAVHKPEVVLKAAIKPQGPSEIAPASAKAIAIPLEKKLSVRSVDPARMARSKVVSRNHHVQRFVPTAAIATSRSHTVAVAPSSVSIPVNRAHYAPAPIARPEMNHHTSRPTQTHTDIFEAAIAHATSHQQLPYQTRRKRNKLVNTLAGITAFLLIAGFITYLNLPSIELHVASARAGFSAQMPGYNPNGYALAGKVQSEHGKVSMSFRSGDSQYVITEQPSDWDSQTLLDNQVALAGNDYKTVQSKGRTIYIYKDDTAVSWVNGGVKYDVLNGADLSVDDLTALATSM